MVKRWHSFGTSVIGPGHIRNGLPNHDAYLSKNTNRFTCIVVADGVGSCKHSDIGSKAVCVAVLEAVRKMLGTKHSLPIKATLELVKKIYLQKITGGKTYAQWHFCWQKSQRSRKENFDFGRISPYQQG